jgi:hypothetical protein
MPVDELVGPVEVLVESFRTAIFGGKIKRLTIVLFFASEGGENDGYFDAVL